MAEAIAGEVRRKEAASQPDYFRVEPWSARAFPETFEGGR